MSPSDDRKRTGTSLDELVELQDRDVKELREALLEHGHALDQTVELQSPEDDVLRRMVGNLGGVAQFFREARRLHFG